MQYSRTSAMQSYFKITNLLCEWHAGFCGGYFSPSACKKQKSLVHPLESLLSCIPQLYENAKLLVCCADSLFGLDVRRIGCVVLSSLHVASHCFSQKSALSTSARMLFSQVRVKRQGHRCILDGPNPGLIIGDTGDFVPFVIEEETQFCMFPMYPPPTYAW